MLRKLFLALVLIVSVTATMNAQPCGILLYSTEGKKFKVYTNGELQNAKAMSTIKLCCFPMDIVKVKLEFEDKSTIEQTLYLRTGFIEHHMVSGKQIVFDSYEEMSSQYENVTNVTIINNINTNGAPAGGNNGRATVTTTTKRNTCSSPMADRSFYEFYGHLKSKSFDSDKLTEAKSAVKRDCFTSKQIKIALGAFTHESSKLEFAKYAYTYVYDKGAYSTVKEGFSNSLTGDELEDYIDKQ